MDIKCPNCETAYQVPEIKIGNKPKKMRCSRCKEVFTVKRRAEETPFGYEEFSGRRNSLPGEFAFLKQTGEHPQAGGSSLPAPELVTVPPEDTFEETTRPGTAPPPIPKSKPAASPPSPAASEPQQETYEDYSGGGSDPFADITGAQKVSDSPEAAPATAPAAEIPLAAPENAMAPQPAPPQQPSAAVSPPLAAPVAAVQAPTEPTPTQTRERGIEDIFGGSGWETEAPLELGSYAVADVQPSQSQKIGKIMGIASAFIFLLFLFVMYRNGWSLSLSELPAQFAFAFSGETYEALPPEVDGLETIMEEAKLIDRGSRGMLLSVIGTVYNNSPIKRKAVILRGRLLDADDEVRLEMKLTCDKVFEESALKRLRPGGAAKLYMSRVGQFHDCIISGESSALYHLVFENVPIDYSDDKYKIKVTPISAR